jgi:hypothetical protein
MHIHNIWAHQTGEALPLLHNLAVLASDLERHGVIRQLVMITGSSNHA